MLGISQAGIFLFCIAQSLVVFGQRGQRQGGLIDPAIRITTKNKWSKHTGDQCAQCAPPLACVAPKEEKNNLKYENMIQ
jgi:hypothetical protein